MILSISRKDEALGRIKQSIIVFSIITQIFLSFFLKVEIREEKTQEEEGGGCVAYKL